MQAKTEAIRTALRSEQLAQPRELTAAFAVLVETLTVVITALNGRSSGCTPRSTAIFDCHSAAGIHRGQPGQV
jgi:hypothetical protein